MDAIITVLGNLCMPGSATTVPLNRMILMVLACNMVEFAALCKSHKRGEPENDVVIFPN